MVPRFLSLAVFSGHTALLAGCLIDGGPFRGGLGGEAGGFASEGGGGSGGSAPAGGSGGGTTTSSTSSTSTSSTSSLMNECAVDADCPPATSSCLAPRCMDGACGDVPANEGASCGAPADECHASSVCAGGVCESVPLPDLTGLPDDKDGDCKKRICDEGGKIFYVPDDGDLPKPNECALYTCDEGDLVEDPKPDFTGCSFFELGTCCGGSCCADPTCTFCN